MAATGNRIQRTETRDRKCSLCLPVMTWGETVAARGQRGRKKDGDLLTHDHGARGGKRRVVEFLDLSRPKARAVNLLSVPLRDRDGTP